MYAHKCIHIHTIVYRLYGYSYRLYWSTSASSANNGAPTENQGNDPHPQKKLCKNSARTSEAPEHRQMEVRKTCCIHTPRAQND